MDAPLLAFYGDDVTGSTDAMDALARAGVRTVLFLDAPDRATLRREFPDADAVGVAGTSRSMAPETMDEKLPRIFEALSNLGAPLVHYKICSTFDSAPDVGSIGRAIEIAADVFADESTPVVPAAPPLGRYVVFGNMFAEDDADVFRLDRHPTMRDHPVTPMDESDLRRHLAAQTDQSIGLVDVLTVREGLDASIRRFERLRAKRGVVFFDALDGDDLRTAGGTVWEACATDRSDPTFVVGSSGVQYALADHWRATGVLDRRPRFDPLPPVDRLLVMSGSASPLTARQIDAALDAGFVGVRIDTADLVDPGTREAARRRAFEAALRALERGDSAIVFAAHGPNDPAIEETRRRATAVDDAPDDVGAFIGTAQGALLRRLLDRTGLGRVCVAGGDTCGRAMPALDAYALRTRYPLAPGSPLCTARSRTAAIDGVELALKGGQLGDEEFFVRAREGADADEWT
ncbi:four-carbon acid sugar kinase family protein [Halegenticoccus tardaugens]|uniref:four-carbon acid sugar kinase family protein n=1 Tax=Halegenticoccus tardaugens TaxID=2071624 RepID=UPI00100BFB9C|nr:four-carbon acid sugar kinase family protein [Halegenticoccus tardaugens]